MTPEPQGESHFLGHHWKDHKVGRTGGRKTKKERMKKGRNTEGKKGILTEKTYKKKEKKEKENGKKERE